MNDAVDRRTQLVDTIAVTNAFGNNLHSELVATSVGTNTYSPVSFWASNGAARGYG